MSNTVIKRKLVIGESSKRFSATDARQIDLVCGGELAYLWIGNSESPMFCYGTLSGAANLRKLAKAILLEVGDG